MNIVTARRILLLGALAFAVVWLTLPDAEAAVTLTPLINSADIAKGKSQGFTISVSSDASYAGQTLIFNVTSIAPSDALTKSFSTPSIPASGGAFCCSTTLTIGTSISTTPRTYTIQLNAYTDGSPREYSNTVTLTLNVGDFGVAVVPAAVEVRQQASNSALVNVSSIASFAGQVSLEWQWTSSTPSGVSVSVTSPVTVSANSWTSGTLTITALSTTPTGTFTGVIIGRYAGPPEIVHTASVTVIIKSLPALDITITASPNPAVVSKLSTITIRVTSEGAPVQIASLTMSSTAGTLGATSGFTDSSGQFLTTFNSTAPGQVSISVTATKTGYITGTNTLVFNVVGNFIVSISPSTVNMTLGSTRTFQVNVQSTDGFNSAVELDVPTVLPGMTATINPKVVTPPPNGVVTATLTVSLNLTAAPGLIDLTVTAIRTPLLKSATLRLNVPVRDFQIMIKPENLAIAQGRQGFFNISIISRGGFTGPIDIRVTGIPNDIEFSIVPNSFSLEVGATRNALLSIRVSEFTIPGSFLFLVEANSGTIRRSSQAVLVVLPLLSVTIDSTPRVSAILIDGVLVPSTELPKQYRWVQGESHTIGVPNPIVNGTPGIRYVFTRWADGPSIQSRIITINSQATYRAEFKIQYFLTVRSTIPISPIPSKGSGWFDNNTQASISTPQIVSVSQNRRYDFRGWTGNITDSRANTTIIMTSPKFVTSNYTLQYFINAITEPKSLAEITNGNKWHDVDSTIDFSTTKRVRDYSFRFWMVDGEKLTGLPVSIRVDRPFNLTANYVLLPKVSIVWANTTITRTEYQGESSYIWLKIANTKDRPGEVRLDVQSTLDGININPKSIVLNFEEGQSYVLAFELRFLRDGTGSFEAKINETAGSPHSISVPLKVFSVRSRDNIRAVGKALSVEILPSINDLMTPTPEVKSLAENILAVANVPQFASPVDKAKALLNFVVQHYEPGTNVNPQSIARMAADLQIRGGALSIQKMSGDSRAAAIMYGGFLRSLDIPVRPLVGVMEMSPTQDIPYVMLHTWLEFRVDREWIFADPAEGLLEISQTSFPSSIQNLARDPKMYYELSPKWGGPISVVAYEGRAVDVTERYKTTIYPALGGYVIYTKGDTSILVKNDKGKDFAQGVSYATVWTPVDPQAAEIRALKPEGQLVYVDPDVQLSKYPIFVSGAGRTDYTFSVMEVSAVFPIIDSMAGSFLERSIVEHTVQVRRDGSLQAGQVEHVSYSDKSITVVSNSTVTSALSSLDVRAVKLTLVGRDGTSGVLNITIPSNILIDDLRSSADKIIVLLDNKFAKPEINDLGNRFVISLKYTHSTRNVIAYLKTFDVTFDIKDPFGLTIYDAELTMEAPTHKEVKESKSPVYKNLIPGQYQFIIRYRGEQYVLNPTITDRDLRFSINLIRSDATIAGFATGIIIAIVAISIITQLILSRVFQRKSTSS